MSHLRINPKYKYLWFIAESKVDPIFRYCGDAGATSCDFWESNIGIAHILLHALTFA